MNTRKNLKEIGTTTRLGRPRDNSRNEVIIAIALKQLTKYGYANLSTTKIAEEANIDASLVAGGISEALLTTAFGLICAVILQLLQNAVIYIIDNQVLSMQKSSMWLVKSIGKRNSPK